MKSQTYEKTLLFDFYGEMLTDRQKEFYDLYYNEDLSLGEIGENYHMSRQGVRDAIVRAENAMAELEEKTGIIRRFQAQAKELEHIRELAAAAEKLTDDPTLRDYLRRISELAAQMKQE